MRIQAQKHIVRLPGSVLMILCVVLFMSVPRALSAPGDVNADGELNLLDVILALRISSGTDVAEEGALPGADVDGDNRIGMQEAVHAMRAIIAGGSGSTIPAIVINEFLASNSQGPEDEDGDTSDWIELHNRGAVAVDLAGWVLTDSSGTGWSFPNITIGAGEFLVVLASGKDRKPVPVTVTNGVSNLHTSFQLAEDGEYLELADPSGIISSANRFSSGYPAQSTDVSYGHSFGGDGWRYHAAPTPGSVNTGDVYEGIIADTRFSVDRGFYTESFELVISTETDGAAIWYTRDGSSPAAGHGSVYREPLQISGTTIIRAAAFRSGWRPSNVDTQTYIFLADVVAQSPEGQAPSFAWPTGSVNDQVFDYGMDPDVVEDPRYADVMDDALLSIPSISLVTDLANLFDPDTGIYVNAIEDGPDWERPTSVELINPDGSDGFQIDAGLRIRGGASRRGYNPKHAFRLFFRREYGDGKLRFPLFGEEGAARFDKIDLRTTMQYSWSIGSSPLCTMTRDVFSRDTQRDMGHPHTRSRYYHLYLNGVYWGMFQTQERSEARYAEAYFGGDKSDYDALKVDSGLTIGSGGSVDYRPYALMATDGNLDAWYRLWDVANAGLASDEPYYRVQGLNTDGTPNPAYEVLLDVANLIDYMLIIFYGGNLDSPVTRFGSNNVPNNLYMIYNRNEPDGFKSFIHDAEHTLLLGNIHGYGEELYTDRTGPFPAGDDRAYSNPQWMHQQLAAHPEYRMRFADHVHRHFFNGGALTPEVSTARFMSRAEEIDTAIIAESARWGDAGSGQPRTKDDDWWPLIIDIVSTWFPQRSDIVLGQLRAKRLYPNTDAPVFNLNGIHQHGGPMSAGGVLTIANPNGSGTIYYTLDGTDPRMHNSQASTTTLVAEDGEKRVLVPTGSIGTAWTGGAPFDEGMWSRGSGGVGYERSAGYGAYISIDVGDAMYGGSTSCYVRHTFFVSADAVDSFNILTLKLRYDDGFVAYINGANVAEDHAPASPQWNSAATGGDADTSSFRTFDISDSLSTLRAGANVLAIHGLNVSPTSSDFLISAELVAGQFIPADASPGAAAYSDPVPLTETTHVSARILDGHEWSALNEATYVLPVVAQSVRITEIMYHPEALPASHPDAEFVELQNLGTQTINLVKTRFAEGIHFTSPNTQIGPNDYVLVVKDQTVFAQQYPDFTGTIAGEYTGSLANDGERIRLEDPTGTTILDFSYGDGWYPITDGEGFSLTIIDPEAADTSIWGRKEGWRPSIFGGGSPGEADAGLLPEPGTIVINEVLAHSHLADPDWVELLNTGEEPVNTGGWYLSDDGDDLMKHEIAAGTVVPAGGYTVLYEDTNFGAAFALSENGEAVYLSSAQDGALTGYREAEDFGASESDVAFGRYGKSTGTYNFVAMEENTPGAANASPKVGPIVISEIMYHPGSGNEDEEYIELHNTTGSEVILQEYDADRDETIAWQFTDGIVFAFPLGTRIPAHGYVLVVKDPASFSAAYTAPVEVGVLGPYDGQLSNAGERAEIGMPGDVNAQGERQYIRIDRVNYDDEAPWPIGPDGAGSSLTRKQADEYGNDVINWAAAEPTPGS